MEKKTKRSVWAVLLALLCVLLCGCQSAAEPETLDAQEPAAQAAPLPEPEPEEDEEDGSSDDSQSVIDRILNSFTNNTGSNP